MIGPQTFGPTPIRSPGGHARSFAETERWLEPRLAAVPVTRVYDATPLDYLGFPVWAAVTPLAQDLTVHAGKGPTPQAALISAMMEAVERVCAEDVDPERVHVAAFTELSGAHALDPALFDLPFQTTYRHDRPISWVRGYDLLAEHLVWVALDLVISPAREGVCTGVETNGLAAGNNHAEATVHALYEVIESDAAAHEQFTSLYCDSSVAPPIRLLDKASLPAVATGWVQVLSADGRSILMQDLSHDVDVPVTARSRAAKGPRAGSRGWARIWTLRGRCRGRSTRQPNRTPRSSSALGTRSRTASAMPGSIPPGCWPSCWRRRRWSRSAARQTTSTRPISTGAC